MLVTSSQDVQALDMDPPLYLQSLGKGEIIVIFLHSYNFQKGPGDDRTFVQRYAHTLNKLSRAKVLITQECIFTFS